MDMKVSELIEKLEQAKIRYGDLEIINGDYPWADVTEIDVKYREEDYRPAKEEYWPDALVLEFWAEWHSKRGA